MKLTSIFYHVDEFCKLFEKELKHRFLSNGKNMRDRDISLSLSEVMTIAIYFHYSGYKTFKDFYTKSGELKSAFPKMTSYNRFLELQQKACVPLAIFAKLLANGKVDGISFADSFPLRVSHEKRISSHKTFRGSAARGKTSMGWFYGFKLHLVINGHGEIIDFEITPGNVADNNEGLLKKITKKIWGKLFGDKGYLLSPKKLADLLMKGIHMVTKAKSNMKGRLLSLTDRLLLTKRGIIESVGAVLKEDFSIEHSRYRSRQTFLINVFSALIAYSFKDVKPTIYKNGFNMLTA